MDNIKMIKRAVSALSNSKKGSDNVTALALQGILGGIESAVQENKVLTYNKDRYKNSVVNLRAQLSVANDHAAKLENKLDEANNRIVKLITEVLKLKKESSAPNPKTHKHIEGEWDKTKVYSVRDIPETVRGIKVYKARNQEIMDLATNWSDDKAQQFAKHVKKKYDIDLMSMPLIHWCFPRTVQINGQTIRLNGKGVKYGIKILEEAKKFK